MPLSNRKVDYKTRSLYQTEPRVIQDNDAIVHSIVFSPHSKCLDTRFLMRRTLSSFRISTAATATGEIGYLLRSPS